MIKGCAFDVGNTLINDTKLVQDSLKDIANWLQRRGIIKQKGLLIATYNKINKSALQPFVSHTFSEEQFFRKTFEELGIKNISSKQVLQKYRQFLINKTKPNNDVIEAFKFLRNRAIKITLLTNERVDRIEAFIRKTALINLLDAVVISEQVRVKKPNPAIFAEASKRLEVKCEEMAMFGDNEITDGGAKCLRIKFVLVTAYKNPEWQWEKGLPIQPDYVIRKIKKKEMEKCLEFLAKF